MKKTTMTVSATLMTLAIAATATVAGENVSTKLFPFECENVVQSALETEPASTFEGFETQTASGSGVTTLFLH